MPNSSEYTASELMTINAARMLRDGDVVFVGVGLPNLACNLARRTHAPGLVMIYESGVIGAQPARLPLSIGDPTLVSGALSVCSMYDIFAFYLQRGFISVGFMGGAQIDRYGNVNATVIGGLPPTQGPAAGLRGSDGNCRLGRSMVHHHPAPEATLSREGRFLHVRRLPGRRAEREAAGLRGGGPQAVVTDLGILEPDRQGELVLTQLHPGADAEQARQNTGGTSAWPLSCARPRRPQSPN